MPKSVSFGDQSMIGNAAVRDCVSGARLLREIFRRLKFIHRFDTDLPDDRHQHEIALELNTAVFNRLGSDEPRGHRPFIIDDSVAIEHVAISPCTVENRVAGAARRPPLFLVHSRIHVAVEAEATTGVGSRPCRNHIWTVRIEGDLARIKTLASHPIVDISGNRSLPPSGTVDVAEVERDFYELLSIDLSEHFLQVDVHVTFFASLIRTGGDAWRR